jgi:hypothetical protein
MLFPLDLPCIELTRSILDPARMQNPEEDAIEGRLTDGAGTARLGTRL